MPDFFYTAQNRHNKEVFGTVKALTLEAAAVMVEARGFRKISVRPTSKPVKVATSFWSRFQGVSAQELAVTSRQLAVMLAAGIGIQEGLAMITRQPLGAKIARAWNEVLKDVQDGSYLSAAMAKHRLVFGNLYVGMVKAGEASGTLTENLRRLADYLENAYMLSNRVKSALTYPVTVFVLSIGLAVFIVQHILPKFLNGLFKDTGTPLPWPTQVLVKITAFFNDPLAMALTAGAFCIAAWMLASHLRTPAGKRQFEQVALVTPGMKGVVSKVLTCRVARTMAALLHSGLLAVPSLELTSDAVDHYIMSDYLKVAVQDLKDGNPMDVAIRAIPLFPPIFPAFVSLGEETGRVPELMDKAAEMFEQDVELALISLTQLIEPLMVAMMGGFVGFILVAIFIPLYGVLGSF